MASAWRRVMVYLGLVDDDEYEEYEPYDEPAPLAPPPPPAPPYRLRQRAGLRPLRPDGAGGRPGLPAHAYQRGGVRGGEAPAPGTRPLPVVADDHLSP